MTVLLEAQGVAVRRSGRELLGATDLLLEPGELVAVVGPNGAGKTTLLRALAGLWECSEGRVLLDGEDLATLPRRRIARSLGFVPHGSRPTFAFTVAELVAMGRTAHGDGRSERDHPAARRAMERTDVHALATRSVLELSAGEMQRVLLARALAAEPRILLLDEPAANLDLAHALDAIHLCRELADAGHTVVVALHDLDTARRCAHRALLLHRGHAIALGDPRDVLSPERVSQVFAVSSRFAEADDEMLHFERRP